MEINKDRSVQFVVGDFVCDLTTGKERCGEIDDSDGILVHVDGNDGESWWVEEKACYPG